MSKLRFLFVLLLLLGTIACDSNTADDPDDLLVVEAFLYAGERVNDVRIKRTIPFGSTDSTSVPVNDATVVLYKEGVSYALLASGGGGFYAYEGEDLVVAAGDSFLLTVEYEATRITSATTVPGSPQNVQLSDDQLVVPDFENGLGLDESNFQLDDLFSITWDNPSGGYYYVVIGSEDPANPDYILPEFARNFIGDFELITEPTTSNFYEVFPFSLSWVGPHFVTVYQVNQEYADLFENREQDSRDLTEPPTNIEGGVGIFTAFNGKVQDFDVVRYGQ